MPIREHPPIGSILLCDFDRGFVAPEMVKRRPVIVISPKIRGRVGLCTVVALSTTEPDPKMPYHTQIDLHPFLPEPMKSMGLWVKGDMVNTVGFHRLNFIKTGNINGKRQYYYSMLKAEQIKLVQECVLKAIGLVVSQFEFLFFSSQ